MMGMRPATTCAANRPAPDHDGCHQTQMRDGEASAPSPPPMPHRVAKPRSGPEPADPRPPVERVQTDRVRAWGAALLATIAGIYRSLSMVECKKRCTLP